MLNNLFRKLSRRLKGSNQRGLISNHSGKEILYDDDLMMVLVTRGNPRECVVSFTGVGHSLGGIDLQSPEFSKWDNDATKIFVIDKHRSWGNDLDWERLQSVIDPIIKDAYVTTLGNSMGGFLALLSAQTLHADRAIAFAPQWSIDSTIVPDEDRWMKYRKKIKEIRFPDLSTAFSEKTKYFVFFGAGEPKDVVHQRFFAEHKGDLEIILVKGCGHDVAGFLKSSGNLYSIIGACRSGDDVKRIIGSDNICTV